MTVTEAEKNMKIIRKDRLTTETSATRTETQDSHLSQTHQLLRGENLSLLDDSGVIHSYHQTPAAHTPAQSWPRAGSLLVALFF